MNSAETSTVFLATRCPLVVYKNNAASVLTSLLIPGSYIRVLYCVSNIMAISDHTLMITLLPSNGIFLLLAELCRWFLPFLLLPIWALLRVHVTQMLACFSLRCFAFQLLEFHINFSSNPLKERE